MNNFIFKKGNYIIFNMNDISYFFDKNNNNFYLLNGKFYNQNNYNDVFILKENVHSVGEALKFIRTYIENQIFE